MFQMLLVKGKSVWVSAVISSCIGLLPPGQIPCHAQQALTVAIGMPGAVTADRFGNVYFSSPNVVFKLDPQGLLTRVAGTATAGFSGDGGLATLAQLNFPRSYPELVKDPIDFSELVAGLAVDPSGNLYIADAYNNRVRRVDANGFITTIVGDGIKGYYGCCNDKAGGSAINARLWWPQGVAADAAGNLFISDLSSHLSKVSPTGTFLTLAGGNCGPNFLQSGLCAPEQIAVDDAGSVYVADGYCRVRKQGPDGQLVTVAGDDRSPANGFAFTCGFSGDGGPATSAALRSPYGVAVDNLGNLYIADTYNHRIRKVDLAGNISTVAGTGVAGFSGDGGRATGAQLSLPHGVAVDAAGNIYIADSQNSRIRKITLDGTIATIAGNGSGSIDVLTTDNSFRLSHLFSNRSGSAQFVQISELSGLDGQDKLAGRRITVTSVNGVTKQFVFPKDLPTTSTRSKAVVLGTSNSSFDDYVLPAGFLPTDGGIINFGDVDSWTFGPLPVDGHSILSRAQATKSLRNILDHTYQPVWVVDEVTEYYNGALDHYFITGSQPEIDALDSGRIAGWMRTGATFADWITRDAVSSVDGVHTPPPGLNDVCRFYIPPAEGDSHFFSASGVECAVAQSIFKDFVLETPSAFLATLPDVVTGVCGNNQTPVYRLWNARRDSNHRYVTSFSVRNDMVRRGYVAEGYGPDAVTMCVGGGG